MKNMKFLVVLSLLGLVGFVGKAKADGYFTTQSTAVFITTGANIEITSVMVGTGSTNPLGSVYAILVDSIPLSADGGAVGNLVNERFTTARYPVSQYITPPIMAYSTASATTNPYTYQSFVDAQGNGRGVEKGLTLFIVNNVSNGANPGVTVTVGYKRKSGGSGKR